jgi:hypothetical protein
VTAPLEGIPLASIARKNWKPYPFQLGGYNCRHHVGFHALWFSNSTSFLNKWEFDRIQEIADSILKPTDAMGRNMIISGIPLFRLMAKDPHGQSAAFDNVPISKNSCKTFLLLKKAKKFEIWDTQGVVFQNPGPYKTRTELKNPESIDSSFLDHFHAFIRKNNYYFITQSGKLYHAPPPKKGEKSRKMTALWDDPTRPINAIIEDTDRDKVFLFAKHKTDAKRGYYFEMKSATTFETFDPTKLKRVNVEGRAKTLLELWPLVGPQAKKKTSRK